MGLGELLDGAFKLLRADFPQLLLAVGVVVVPLQLLLAFVSEQVATRLDEGMVALEQRPEAVDVVFTDLARELPALLVVGLLQTLLLLLATAAVVRIGGARYLGSRERAMPALGAAARRFPSLLAAQLLIGLIVVAAIAVPIVIILAGAVLGQDALVLIGFLAFLPVVPLVIFLYIRFAVNVPAIMLEGTGALGSLRRSARLVKGRWWPVFGVLIVAWIVVGVVGTALGFIPNAVAGFLASEALRAVVTGIGNSISGLITQPVTALVVLLLYFDARIRKEGLDLELRTGGPGSAAERPQHPRSGDPRWQPGGSSPG
jgi:hypothetical protein